MEKDWVEGLKFASEELRGNADFMLKAVKEHDSQALKLAEDNLADDLDFVVAS